MQSLLDHPNPSTPRHRQHPVAPRRARTRTVLIVALVSLLVLAFVAVVVQRVRTDDSRRHYVGADGWPTSGQAAYTIGGVIHASPGQAAAPIASLAKVMTAYLVLQAHPLNGSRGLLTLRVSAADVSDTAQRRARDESVVAVRAGEMLSERQALVALLLPSANNVAVMLARTSSGTVPAFVAAMNTAARRLGMSRTRYTDPSGYEQSTVSSAADQLRLATAVAQDPDLTALVALESADLPVAGTVHNTDRLLGTDGFVGTKTGSDDAAGGCFMFRTRRVVDGQARDLLGVVLGQPGRNLVNAGQFAARQLADRIAPAA